MATNSVSRVLEGMKEVVLLQLLEEVNLVAEVEEKVRNIYKKFKRLEHVLPEAELRRLEEEELRVLLGEVEETSYDMEEVLEEWRSKIKDEGSGAQRRKPRRRMPTIPLLAKVRFFSASLKQVHPEPSDIAFRIEEINDRLESIEREADKLKFVATPRRGHVHMTEFDISKVRGRRDDVKSLLRQLLPKIRDTTSSTEVWENRVKVISILGDGDIGKTMLAKFLYHLQDVKKNFEPRNWLCVSDHRDDKEMTKALIFQRPAMTSYQSINGFVSGKRFLLVLDNFRAEDSFKWEHLRNAFEDGAPGSIILVTTRSEHVVKAVRTHFTHKLGPLSKFGCWEIIKQIALSEKPNLCDYVEDIGLRIAEYCKGSPTAANFAGNHFRSRNTKEEWEADMELEIWKMEAAGKSVLYGFYRKFRELSPQLKRCFSYCALYPRNAVIDVEQLIRCWKAEGYVDEISDKSVELEGIECFQYLADKCFFHDLVKDSIHKNKVTSCRMYEAVHVLAQYTARRHLPWLGQMELKSGPPVLENGEVQNRNVPITTEFSPQRNIRSFLKIGSQVSSDLFKHLKSVKALVLSACHLEELPSEVGMLTRVQYLDLSANPLKKLPETICILRHLEFIDVRFCYLLLSLPQRIGHLQQQLRHLRINHTTDELQNLPEEFEKLNQLQTLDVFRAGGRYNDVKKVRDLSYLEEVRISVHGRVDFGEVLENKTNLENLELCFVGEGRDPENVRLIEILRPPPKLQMLKFEDYPGRQLPSWILAESLFHNLRRLSIRSALNIRSLPALGKLPCLEFLWLFVIPNLKHLGIEFFGFTEPTLHSENEDQAGIGGMYEGEDEDDEEIHIDQSEEDEEPTAAQGQSHAERAAAFPKLTTLRVEHLEHCETWEELNEIAEERSGISVMPCLVELIIRGCPKLKKFPKWMEAKIDFLRVYEDDSSFRNHQKNMSTTTIPNTEEKTQTSASSEEPPQLSELEQS